jgi:hypothetical protein
MLRTSFSRRVGTAAVALVVGCGSFLVDGSTGSAASQSSGPAREMIVILRNQNSSLAARSAVRNTAVRAEQAPILASLRASGATHITSLSLVNAVVARMSPAEARLLAAIPAVSNVLENSVIPGPAPSSRAVLPILSAKVAYQPGLPTATFPRICGTTNNPQLNPEALSNINATPSQLGNNDGSGVTVAVLADGLDTGNPDLQRNADYGTPGHSVVKEYDFSSDGTTAPTSGEEALGDASSIAAQGNVTYDLSQFVSTANPLPPNCDIKIIGVAPGANVEVLKVFAQNNDTTESGILQAINFAVASGAKVINESFGTTNLPDTALDVTREANDAAVAAGVTVVVSTGDAGITSTIGSPATDPAVISVGATTTYRAYVQDTYGGINDPNVSGAYVDNNIASFSSGGYTQAGNTVDLVAPGDLNWALCSTDVALFGNCTNENGAPSPIALFGGTSESAPLTAGAAADVIQAYASTHNGNDPAPALVKQILVSTATDIGAPATEQGAGLLNVFAAVREAKSIRSGFGIGNSSSNTFGGGLLLDPGQINVVQGPGDTSNESVRVTNTGANPITVNLSTRALASTPASTQSNTFCMNPARTASCPHNSGAFPIWNGVSEIYQDEHFTVPTTNGPSRLEFATDYQDTGQASVLHVALIEPDGAYAAYSEPQGFGDYGELEVTNPPSGKWTAVFFTEAGLNYGATPNISLGTSGQIQWSANTFTYVPGGNIFPSTLTIAPGQTDVAHLFLTSSNVSGDSSQSIVVSSPYGTTTVPVTIRTTVPIDHLGGTFSGVLTGGNGRFGAQAAMNTYAFNVPPGVHDLDVSVALAKDPNDAFIAELVDPNGQTVGFSSNITTDNLGNPIATQTANLYTVNPLGGQWTLIITWFNPVSGLELSEPFTGTIQFNQANVSSNLPNGHASIRAGGTQTFNVNVTNTGNAPEAFFVDPRLNQNETVSLPDLNIGSAEYLSLPLPPANLFPYYLVPTQTSQLRASITGSAPVTFDLEYLPGDPDVSPGVYSPWTSGSIQGNSANVVLNEPEVSPGLWLLNPAEIGPFPSTGAPPVSASANLSAVTQTFDPSITSSTGDMWSALNGLSKGFSPTYLAPGGSTTITVTVTPTDPPGTMVSGTLYVDDYSLAGTFSFDPPNADELAAIPYSYTVSH